MSNYVVATNFGAKDALISGNPAKLILGAQLTTEFNNIATAIATKADLTGATFTGAVNANLGLTVSGAGFTSRGILDQATATALTLGASGNVTIAAPSSGVALSLSSVIGNAGVSMSAPAAANAYFQLSANAGGTLSFIGASGAANGLITGDVANDIGIRSSSQINFSVSNSPARVGYFDLAGNLNIANGTGSLSPVYSGIPTNPQSANYTLVLGDANKNIVSTAVGAVTFTIIAGFPIGTGIAFSNRGGGNVTIANNETMLLAGTSSSGSRTLTSLNGVATAWKVGAGTWIISGTGLT